MWQSAKLYFKGQMFGSFQSTFPFEVSEAEGSCIISKRALSCLFPHVLCCDTVRRQVGVVKPKWNVVHKAGWRFPPAVTTFRCRGGTGTTAGSTACRTTQTWSLSTAERSRSISSWTTSENYYPHWKSFVPFQHKFSKTFLHFDLLTM